MAAKGLSDPEQWPEVINTYRGNTLVLKIVATTIQELFAGQVSEFLKSTLKGRTVVIGAIRTLLSEQFARLSDLEKAIMYWLAIERQPVSLEQLQERMWLYVVSETDLFDALESLGWRSLIERSVGEIGAGFTLQLVVLEYVNEQLR